MASRDGKSETKLTVLISGSGTNLQALINACGTEALPNTTIIRVISDRKDAYGLQRAEAAGIPTSHLGILPFKRQHPDESSNPQFLEARRAYDTKLQELVLADKPDLVVCAGFMRILTTAFLDPVKASGTPIINLHPSLPGDLVGVDCVKRAWEGFQAGQRTKTGIMIHYVIAEVDKGEPVVWREIAMKDYVRFEDLEERIHQAEHELIVEGTRKAVERLKAGLS